MSSIINDFQNQLRQVEFGISKMEVPRNLQLADWMFEKIVEMINDFEANLPDDKQAGGRLVGFRDTVFGISDVGYQNPNLIIFYGKLVDGSEVQLVQHISQLNLLLIAVQRQDPDKPRRKIGFSTDDS